MCAGGWGVRFPTPSMGMHRSGAITEKAGCPGPTLTPTRRNFTGELNGRGLDRSGRSSSRGGGFLDFLWCSEEGDTLQNIADQNQDCPESEYNQQDGTDKDQQAAGPV